MLKFCSIIHPLFSCDKRAKISFLSICTFSSASFFLITMTIIFILPFSLGNFSSIHFSLPAIFPTFESKISDCLAMNFTLPRNMNNCSHLACPCRQLSSIISILPPYCHKKYEQKLISTRMTNNRRNKESEFLIFKESVSLGLK